MGLGHGHGPYCILPMPMCDDRCGEKRTALAVGKPKLEPKLERNNT